MAAAKLIDRAHIVYENTHGYALRPEGVQRRDLLRRAAETGQAIALTLEPGERVEVLRTTWAVTANRMGLRVRSMTQPDGTLGLRVARREVGA